MDPKTKTFQPYSIMKSFRSLLIILIVLLCYASHVVAQNSEVRIIYDWQKKTLFFDNKTIICLYPVDGQVQFINDIIRDKGGEWKIAVNKNNSDNENNTLYDIYPEYIGEHDSITVFFRNDEDDFDINTSPNQKIPIEIVNRPVKAENIPAEANNQLKKIALYVVAPVILIIIIILIIHSLHKKRKKKTLEKSYSNVIQIIAEETNDNVVGLDYVQKDIDNYFTLDMKDFFQDTAVKKVYIKREAIHQLNNYFKSFLENPERTNETGCYLIGGWESLKGNSEQYNISIEELVTPGDDVIYGEYSLNFGLKIGIKLGGTIQNLCEKTGRDYVHTAWMHSHPGLGLFLSSHDLIVQKQLTYEDAPKRMIAIVIDTNTPDWQMAIFSSKNNGNMNNKEDLLKTISFDVLNDWCRQRISTPKPSISLDNSLLIESDDKTLVFAFSAKAINQIDDLLYAQNNNTFPLYGVTQQKGTQDIYFINSCTAEDEKNQIGHIIIDDNKPGSLNESQYAEQLESGMMCLVYHTEDQIQLIYKKDENTTLSIPTSMKTMREWTRRKRI